MINPQLHDWWSSKHLTEIRIEDSSVSGAGVTLQVIFPIFSDLKITWFSKCYGEFDDNLLLLGFDNFPDEYLDSHVCERSSQIQSLFNRCITNEYALTDKIATDLGFRFTDTDYSIERENLISYQLFLHDNVFFYIKPVDDFLLQRLIENVLQQHSFYLGEEIDWSDVVDYVIQLLVKNERIDLQSDRRRHCLWIPSIEQKSFLWKIRKTGTILICDGKAHLRENILEKEAIESH